MSRRIRRVGWIGTGWALAWVLAAGGQAETIYDNSHRYLDQFHTLEFEYGDELILDGEARTITEFRFEYFGEFTGHGEETCRVRFYRNDGPPVGRYDVPSPGKKLYDSGPFPIFPGLQVKVLRDLEVKVPGTFIWTVQFDGLLDVPNNRVGLTFFNPPAAGFSFDDYWQRQGEKWKLFRFGGDPVANFGVRVKAEPGVGVELVSVAADEDERMRWRLKGPEGRRFVLEYSGDLRNWQTLSTNQFEEPEMEFTDGRLSGQNPRFFRPRLLPETEVRILSQRANQNNQFNLELLGPEDRYFRVRGTTNFLDWQGVRTKLFTGRKVEVSDSRASQMSRRFYRARLVPVPELRISGQGLTPDGKVQIQFAGPAGADFLVQSSEDLIEWTTIATNTIAFADELFDFVDPQPADTGARFYRARLLE